MAIARQSTKWTGCRTREYYHGKVLQNRLLVPEYRYSTPVTSFYRTWPRELTEGTLYGQCHPLFMTICWFHMKSGAKRAQLSFGPNFEMPIKRPSPQTSCSAESKAITSKTMHLGTSSSLSSACPSRTSWRNTIPNSQN